MCAPDCHVPVSVLLQLGEFIQTLPTATATTTDQAATTNTNTNSSGSSTVPTADYNTSYNYNNNSSNSNTQLLYPTSIIMGIFTHAIYLINTSITAINSTNSNSNNNIKYQEYVLANINNNDNSSDNNLISRLLSAYNNMCSVSQEDDFIEKEESLYRSFSKRQRRQHRGPSNRLRRSKRRCYYSRSRRRPVSGSGDRNVLQEDSEGEIQSIVSSTGDSNSSDSIVEIVKVKRSRGSKIALLLKLVAITLVVIVVVIQDSFEDSNSILPLLLRVVLQYSQPQLTIVTLITQPTTTTTTTPAAAAVVLG